MVGGGNGREEGDGEMAHGGREDGEVIGGRVEK